MTKKLWLAVDGTGFPYLCRTRKTAELKARGEMKFVEHWDLAFDLLGDKPIPPGTIARVTMTIGRPERVRQTKEEK